MKSVSIHAMHKADRQAILAIARALDVLALRLVVPKQRMFL